MRDVKIKLNRTVTWEDLIRFNTFNETDVKKIKEAINEGDSFIVIGGTGSGCTTIEKLIVENAADRAELNGGRTVVILDNNNEDILVKEECPVDSKHIIEIETVKIHSIEVIDELDKEVSLVVVDADSVECLNQWEGQVIIGRRKEDENELIKLMDDLKGTKYGCKKYILIKVVKDEEGSRRATIRELNLN